MTPPDAPMAAGGPMGEVRNVPFNFRLGVWTMFSIVRRLAVVEAAGGVLPETWAPDPAGTDGCLVKGLHAPAPAPLLSGARGWSVRVFRRYPRYLVDLTTGFDAYMAKFSGKTRANLKKKLRKFHELSGGAAVWKQYRTPAEIGEFLSLARPLSQKTYQERLLGAGLPTNAQFTEVALSRAARDAVRGFILFLDAKAISYLYLPIEGDRAVYAFLGYDPSCAEHSPGTVLQLLAMEALFAEPGVSIFDFTEGAGQHKQLFSTHAQECVDLLFVKRGSPTAVVSAVNAIFERIVSGLTGVLERTGIKNRLKRLMRGAAQHTETA
jgi:CelD/BcsL family acetyltransferase involved in cellulose biosynthesis